MIVYFASGPTTAQFCRDCRHRRPAATSDTAGAPNLGIVGGAVADFTRLNIFDN